MIEIRISLAAIYPVVLLLIPCAADARGDDFASRRLSAAGISPDERGIADYLRSLLPDAGRTGRSAKLLERLGSDDFHARQEATRELAKIPDPPLAALEAAARSEDAEVRMRARQILRRMDRQAHVSTALTALDVVRTRRMKGLTAVLLELLSIEQEPQVHSAARRALIATVDTDDESLLRRHIEAGDPPMQAACLTALAAACGDRCAPELLRRLDEPDDRIRLAAAEGLGLLGNRACLGPLVEFLESERMDVRHASGNLLRALTGQKFGYAAHAPAEDRKKRAQAWRTWVSEQGATAALRHPDIDGPAERGRILVCIWADKSVIEVDSAGSRTFSADGFDYVWGCQGLPNGHRLVVDAERRLVLEYDAAGKVCWRRDDLPGRPTSVQRLPDGNTLLALSDAQMVIEVALSGEIVWQVTLQGRPTTAQRIDDDRTVVNLQDAGQVVEINRTGDVLWRITGLRSAHTAQVLDNGNVLVCEMKSGTVAEYNRDGQVVWSRDEFSNPAQAQRLPNGNTLVADEYGLHEIDHEGTRVWNLKVSRARFHRY